MNYLGAHLTIGIVLLGTVLVQHYFEKRRSKPTNDLADLLAPVQDESSLVKRIWENIIRPVLGGILVVIAWPLVLIFVAIKLFAPSKKKKTSEPIAFAVSTDDLKKKLSIAEIEEREMILDPLKAVPDLPFGHLHSTWATFLDSIEPDSELWSFDAIWTGDWQGPQKMAGYVAVMGNHLGPHLITMQKSLGEKDDSTM